MAVYSEDRVRRLRVVVAIVLVLVALLGVFSVFLLGGGEGSERTAGALGLAVGAVVGGSAVTALVVLPAAERPAKVACVTTGVLTVLAGLVLIGTWLALLLPLLGAGVVFLALVADPDA